MGFQFHSFEHLGRVLPFLSSESFSLLEEKYRGISLGLTLRTLWIKLGIECFPAYKCTDRLFVEFLA